MELVVVLAVLSLLLTIAFVGLRPLYDPLNDATHRFTGFLRQARAKAMATTSAYRVFLTDHTLQAKWAQHCNDPEDSWTIDPRLTTGLPEGVRVVSNPPDAALCFTSRGYANASIQYTLTDRKNRSRSIEVLLGGAVEVK